MRSVVSDGSRQEHGQYLDGLHHGVWRVWTTDENLAPVQIRETEYVQGKLHGSLRTWYSSGAPRVVGAFFAGDKHGIWIERSENGTELSRGKFQHGVEVGEHTENFANGKPMNRRMFDETGRPHGEWCFWLRDGTVVDCYVLQHGTGHIKQYGSDGTLLAEYGVLDGEFHGPFVDYAFGLTTYRATYDRGRKHGLETVERNGCIETERTFADGIEDGPYLVRDCDQEPPVVVHEGQRCDNQACGRWVDRDPETGRKVVEYEYAEDGTLLGQVRYDEAGNPSEFYGDRTLFELSD